MLNLSHQIEIQRPSILRFGEGAVSGLSEWVHGHGFRKPFVVSDRVNVARLDILGLSDVAVFGDVVPEPDEHNLNAAIKAASGCDLVIGFGGGSAMDLAKLVSVMVDRDVLLSDISGPGRAPKRRVGLVQIPTTAGTGSEVGTRALVTDPSSLNKVATESIEMLADITIIDPVLTISVPADVTAATGVDALAHCVEAFTSKRAHPLIDGYALQGIELVGKYLARAVKDGGDIEARSGMALAAFYGGVCLGPVNTTAGHAVSYPLGTRHKLPHGLANALMFPHVLAINEPAVPEKTRQVARALGMADYNGVEDLRDASIAFCASLGMCMDIGSYGVPEVDFENMAAEAHAIRRLLDWNPVDLSRQDIIELYKAAS
ncbi:iron-containing alcohol dehydrogenase [Thalassospira xiamenensis]|uniref:Alcohol dehydrogenase n=1 Tax=Thalassospira xiamenensis TaxID=220697 RepID=A0A367X8R1_9PROT|nr:iron-containing alcohol dehydrogenase [Thalassospira xiamenensis]KZB56323.1 alcohol dehydrogenase [Thalassospira xiamenensis]MCK2167235.1 iron-containing alcohol dehydrogenase [Thalassospira xiamenensis]RCK49967.1 alcohol dehydrogenase [Thalassospira xiamenensis]